MYLIQLRAAIDAHQVRLLGQIFEAMPEGVQQELREVAMGVLETF